MDRFNLTVGSAAENKDLFDVHVIGFGVGFCGLGRNSLYQFSWYLREIESIISGSGAQVGYYPTWRVHVFCKIPNFFSIIWIGILSKGAFFWLLLEKKTLPTVYNVAIFSRIWAPPCKWLIVWKLKKDALSLFYFLFLLK